MKAGEKILKIDTSASRLELEKIEDQLAKKVNEQRQLRINLEKSLSDLHGQIERQKLDADRKMSALCSSRRSSPPRKTAAASV